MQRINWAVMVAAAALVAAAGCGGGEDAPGDVLIIVPDYGQADVVADSVVPDEGNVDRDASGNDVVGDIHVAVDAAADEGGSDLAVIPDEGVDAVEDTCPLCSLGQEICYSQSGNRMTCETASVLGRTTLATVNGIAGYNDTINEKIPDGPNKNDDELDDDGCPWFPGDDDPLWCQDECDDDGPDHFFKVYLIPGDLFSMTVSNWRVVEHPDYQAIDFMLKVYKGDCQLNRENLLSCTNVPVSETRPANNNIQIKPVSSGEEGWYTIVLDSTGSDQAGTYDIDVHLFQNSEYTGEWDLCCD